MWILLQTTLPAINSGGFASWGVAEWILIIGSLTTAITGIILALRGQARATIAETKADAVSARQDRQSVKVDKLMFDSVPPPEVKKP